MKNSSEVKLTKVSSNYPLVVLYQLTIYPAHFLNVVAEVSEDIVVSEIFRCQGHYLLWPCFIYF